MLAWVGAPDAGEAGWRTAAGVVLFLATLMASASLWRLGRGDLHFDGRNWWSAPAGSREAAAGSVEVAIDLGGFFLLRFRSAEGGRRRWLPVDAREAGVDWHALRCALYSARPEPAEPGAGASAA